MTDIYKQAILLYSELSDMDYLDYEETREQDLNYLVTLILKQGYNSTLLQLLDQ